MSVNKKVRAEPRADTAPASNPPAVQLVGVSKAFTNNVVLNDLHVRFETGKTTCLIGRSGSGKSTLLRSINGLEVVDEGEVLVFGEPVVQRDRELNALRSRIGMVFQQYNLFPHLSVLRNITLALEKVHGLSADQAEAQAREALDMVGMGRFAGQRPDRLSGGQQQRVAIARTVAAKPEIVLFDEVTSALDPELVKGVLGLMTELSASGMTMIVVTHEMTFAREVASVVGFMHEGRIAAMGTPAEIFEQREHPALQQFLDQVL